MFRIAHSMKGMSATMGFAGMAALTHETGGRARASAPGAGGLGREAVDVLLECLDALSAATDAIEAAGAEAIERGPLVERLRRLVRERTRGQDKERHGDPQPPENLAELTGGARVVPVTAVLAGDVQMAACALTWCSPRSASPARPSTAARAGRRRDGALRARRRRSRCRAGRRRPVARGHPVRVWAQLGRASMPTAEFVGLSHGAVVELDQSPDDPIDLYVNGRHFPTGRLVVVDGDAWAVRIESVLAPSDDTASGTEGEVARCPASS